MTLIESDAIRLHATTPETQIQVVVREGREMLLCRPRQTCLPPGLPHMHVAALVEGEGEVMSNIAGVDGAHIQMIVTGTTLEVDPAIA